MKTLHKGDKGTEVVELQKLLGIKADGDFGTITESGVRSFQYTHGIIADGIVGVATWMKLGKSKPATDRDKLISRFGNPMEDPRLFETQYMMTFFIQKEFPEVSFPKVYMNRHLIPEFKKVIAILKQKNLLKEIKTYGGCWLPRYIRGYEAQKILSIHTWALAIDFNASDNPLGMTKQQALDMGLTPFSKEFDQVWRDCGWVCGIDFKRGDGMHYQNVNV